MNARPIAVAVLSVAASFVVACGGAGDVTPPVSVASVTITPASLTIERGAVAILVAEVRTTAGTTCVNPSLVWTSADTSIAVVSPAGHVTGARAGTTRIVATVDGRTAIAPVTVTDFAAATLASLVIEGMPQFTWPGDTAVLIARARNRWGEQLPTPPLQWTSSLPDVVQVSPSGLMRTRSVGTAGISVFAGNVSATLPVVVDPLSAVELGSVDALVAGAEKQVPLFVRRGANTYPVSIRWTSTYSSDPSVATLSATGVIRGVGVGQASFGMSGRGLSFRDEVTVTRFAGSIAVLEGGALTLLPTDGSAARVVALSGGQPLQTKSAAIAPNGREVAYDCVLGVCRLPLDGSAAPIAAMPGNGNSSPSWTGDGRSVAVRASYVEIGIAVMGSPGVRLIWTFHYIERPRISPDGLRLAFECDHFDPYEAISDLCFMTSSGPGVIATVRNASAVAWSPDGQRIAYLGQGGLCTAPIGNPSDCTVVLPRKKDEIGMEAAWNPEGTQLVVARGPELWLVEPNGANPLLLRRTARTEIHFASPSWGAAR